MTNGLRRPKRTRAAYRLFGLGLVTVIGVGALLVGCPHNKGPAHLLGGSFPVNNGGSLEVQNASDLTSFVFGQTIPIIETVQIADQDDGRWGEFLLDPSPSVLRIELTGGTFVGFNTSSTLQTGALRALQTSENGRKVEIEVSVLSHLGESMAIASRLAAGKALEQAVPEANAALGGYFSVGLDLSVPATTGVSLWDGTGSFFSGNLTPGGMLGLVTAAFMQRVSESANLSTLEEYAGLVAIDAADGVADGIVHPPFTGAVTKLVDIGSAPPDYPSDPLGTQLATDIETFLASANNRSGLSTTDIQDLLARLRLTAAQVIGGRQFLPKGVVLVDVPVIGGVSVVNNVAMVTAPATLKNFVTGARVFFGQTASAQATVLDAGTIRASVPNGVTGTVFVTVINPDGKRHSFETTIP